MSDSSAIKVTVKHSTDEPFTLEIEPELCIIDLKLAIEKEKEIPVNEQRIVFSGKVLADEQILYEAGFIVFYVS